MAARKFKIGDRVRVVRGYGVDKVTAERYIGRVGYVTEILESSEYPYAVRTSKTVYATPMTEFHGRELEAAPLKRKAAKKKK